MHRDVSSHLVGSLLVLASGLAVAGQEPISDKLEVTLPHTTWVGSQSLAPGTYRIRQLPTASSPRLLEFSSDNGTKMETAITTFAAIGNNTQHDTSVTLEQKDGQYHLTHVWIAGKTYGYQLPIDGNRQQASKSTSETVTIAGTFTPNQPAPPTQEPTRAQAPEPPKQEQPQVAQAETAAPPAAAPAQTPEQPKQEPQQVAQAEAPPQAPVTPERPAAPAKTSEFEAQTPPMPATATHWPDLMLGGALLVALGLIVRPASSSRS